MDYTDEELEDLATMRALRQRLRALAEARIAALEKMAPPTSALEASRQCRAIVSADRLIVTLFNPPSRRRKRSDSRRDTRSPVAPDLPPPPAVPDEPSIPEDVTASTSTAVAEVTEAIAKVVHRCAQWAGVWPDGARCLPGQSGWRKHVLTEDLILPDDDQDAELWLGREVLKRCNLIARQSGRLTGLDLDKKPYSDNALDYFALSANFSADTQHPASHERPGPDVLPWWIVRQPPPL